MKRKIVIANTFFSRLKGLMFKKNVDYFLLIPRTNGIHTFMIKFNLDLIIINEKNIVIDIIKNVKPNTIIRIKRSRKKTSILEIPSHLTYDYKINSNYLD